MSNDVSLDINPESNPVQTVAPPKEDNNMLRATNKITALYCRLSVEDTKEKGGKDDPSNSIQNQKAMLEEFAARQGFTNIVHAEERQARQLIMHRNQERYRNSLSKQKRNDPER